MDASKDNDGGNIWPSHRKVEWVGPDKYKNYKRQRESSKPNTQLGSSSTTSASSSTSCSEGKDKSK